ncbi:MAG TPA: methylmalonyl-CoA mutase family protein [Thermoanaerobaculia bacterium]|nr:methylmalonyl-CoA mutase family protein [Thermoanaerobaculia bacterium]HEV8609564.1 methylmalonyl-CoA mutase family protein [Thermoanaerobaculia bacterium]
MPIEPFYGEPPPGEFPFTRGITRQMYRGRLWTMRQYAGYGSARESNRRYRYLLEQGQTGLSVAFDLPTQMGYDADHPLARGEVGKAGVAISTIEDMRLLTEGLPLGQVSISMTINSTAAILLALHLSVARERGIPWEELSGTVQNDILKEYAARGTYVFPPRPSLKIATDILEFCGREVPRWNTISISGYHIREAGSTAVQEVAFTLANGIAYVEAAIARGLAVDSFAPRISFFFNAHSNFFEEVAKFRAARSLWAEIMRDRFGAKDPRSWRMRFHVQTAGSTLTAQQPDVNVVRVALQALSAVLGGTQSLHTNAADEALALPTERAARLALRTQQVIGFESGVADVADPLGGSAFVETWTDEIRERARRLIEKIDSFGGAVAAIERGWVQREIEEAAYQAQQEVEDGRRIVVGVNAFREEGVEGPPMLTVDPEIERDQVERLQAFRSSREGSRSAAALSDLERDAREDRNLMPPLVTAVGAGATVGEIVSSLKSVYGEHRP